MPNDPTNGGRALHFLRTRPLKA
ncbi:hypothetical protein [Parasutterella sp.]